MIVQAVGNSVRKYSKVFLFGLGINCHPLVSFMVAERGRVLLFSEMAFLYSKGVEMKKFAAMLMLVCSLGVFAVVGCEDKKPATPAVPAAPADKDKMAPATPPATPPTTPPAPSK